MTGQDAERPAAGQNSEPRCGRASVPMWDSSDPERAPPPLPLHERQVGGSASPTRPHTSEHVAAAARALIERGRANWDGAYNVNPSPARSPERMMPGNSTPQHKRLKSLQDAGIKDIRTSIETPSDRGSRAGTPSFVDKALTSSPPPSPTRSPTATPTPRRNRDTRSSIFGEGSPASDTMLALRNMQLKDDILPLNDTTNDSLPSSPTPKKKMSHDIDHLSTQIQKITTIATHLQQEMTALSRRSKDNATDLIGLREATNSRDEDIRETLRALVSSVRSASETGFLHSGRSDSSRSSSAMGYQNHPFANANLPKGLQLPRLSFDPPSDDLRSPSSLGAGLETTPSIAMLEKILREMVTKEGQEHLVASLQQLLDRSGKDSSETMKRLEDLVESLREKSDNLALVRHPSTRRSRSLSTDSDEVQHNAVVPYSEPKDETPTPQGVPHPDPMTDELQELLQRIKDSVSHGGGIMGEVKSLVRELRGEVLGMGRDLGRKLDQVQVPEDKALIPRETKDEYQQVIQESLGQLQEQMSSLIEARRRASSGSALSRDTVDTQEVFEAVKHQLAQYGLDGSGTIARDSGLDRESILAAVREAYEEYKPEIELQQFGLERDEILQCLKEGLEDYQANKSAGAAEHQGLSRDEIMETIHASMQQFQPPNSPSAAGEIKEEVIAAVKECLQEFSVPTSRDLNPGDLSREDIVGAVKDGLGEHAKEGARVLELDQEGLLDAVKAGLEQTHVPYGQQVIDSLHDIIGGMREEFKEYSAANGRDTEQVLDALKDGLESLRAEIESYVDRAQDVTGKDEIIDTLKAGINTLQDGFQEAMQNRSGTPDSASVSQRNMIDYLKAEFESLHDTINTQSGPRGSSSEDKEQIVAAITQGFATLGSVHGERGVDEPSEELLDAFKAEFEQLREDLMSHSGGHKDEILEALQDSLAGLHQKMGGSELGSQASYEIVNTMREEMNALRESMQAPVVHSGDPLHSSKEEIVESLKSALESIRVQLSADQSDATQESLGIIREELETFRAAVGGSLMLSTGNSDKEEIIDAIKAHFDTLPTASPGLASGGEDLARVLEEIERLRESYANAIAPLSTSQVDTTEFKEAMQDKLDELKNHFESQIVSTERSTAPNEEFFVGTLSDHLDTLKTDIGKLVDKPVDMTVSYEILETLKDGLHNVRSDIEHLKSQADAVVLADGAKGGEAAESLQKSDMDRVEVMLAQLQIKVEAMDSALQNRPSGADSFAHDPEKLVTKDDLAGIESLVRDLHISVGDISSRGLGSSESGASNETSEAIETLLQNTKAKIDDHIVPGLENMATREHLETVEAMVKLTHDAAEGLTSKLDDRTASKDDVAALAHLLASVTESLTTLKDQMPSEDGEKLPSKTDIDAVGGACLEIKDKLGDLALDALPSKADMEQLTGLLHDLRESHDKMKESYEGDIAVTAKAFDDRKEESAKLADNVEDLKALVEDTREELKQRLRRGNADVRAIDEILESIELKIDEANAVDDVQEFSESVKGEFEKAHEVLEAIKCEQGDQATSILEKSEEHRNAIISELREKMEELFKDMVEKHEISHAATLEATKAVNDKSEEQEKLLAESKSMAEELKVTIDTLGATVTGIDPALKEATDKMTEDARTVFSRVDDIHAKLEDNHGDIKAEHEALRAEFTQAHATMSELRGDVNGQHPQYMDALKSLLEIAEQHFEHSRKFQEVAEGHHTATKAHFDEGITRLPVPQIEAAPATERYDDSALHGKISEVGDTLHFKLEQLMNREMPAAYDDSELRRKIEELLSREPPRAADSSEIHDKLDGIISKEMPAPLDDAPLHSKLDELIQHVKTPAPIAKLDEIHRQVMTTADEISALLAVHQRSIEGSSSSKDLASSADVEHAGEQERRREAVEAQIVELSDTKAALDGNISSLRQDNERLVAQKLRLSADVASLETALQIRRSELHDMDERAKALERRVLEGIMDHSRALLLTKQPRAKVNMNLKRVTSNNSTASNMTTTPTMVNSAASTVSIALPPASKMISRSKTTANPASRRIASLNQITGNVPSGGKAYAAAPRATNGGLMSLKRSQSVRTQNLRKTSWQPGSLDKENGPMVEEENEADAASEVHADDEHYDGGSRATSYTGTSFTGSSYTGTMSAADTYDDGSVAGDSEYTYGTGSYLTGSSIDRRSSAGSVIRSTSGTLGVGTPIEESVYEDEGEEGDESEDDDGNGDADETVIQHGEEGLKVLEQKPGLPRLHTDGYDSGLGSDLPTAQLSAVTPSHADYFRDIKGVPRIEEEAAEM